jgi:hypothetical protein
MSRKIILSIAAAATVAVATLASQSADARGGGQFAMARGGRGAISRPILTPRVGLMHRIKPRPIGRLCVLGRPCRPPGPPIWWHHHHHHHHHHWVLRGGRWIIDDVVEEAPVVAVPVAPSPCTCLTKTYTATGLVVFADICTKESASAPATDDHADASQAPTTSVAATATPISEVPTAPNYAGRTYEDFLAANPQLAQPQASSAAPPQQ